MKHKLITNPGTLPVTDVNTAPFTGVMPRLKQATSPWHTRLEHSPAMRRLLDPELSRAAYTDLLRRFHRAISACERHLQARAEAWRALGLDWSPRLIKTRWLEADLAQLDHPFQPGAQDLADQPAPYAGEGFARAAGCLYVLEGSTRGSRVILRLLARARQHPAAGADRYFTGYGPDTEARWSTLVRELEEHLSRGTDSLPQAIAAACETFCFVEDVLND